MLSLLSGNILLANSKSCSVLAAEKRNFHPLDNMRYLKPCTLHTLVVSQIESVFGCWESKRKSTFVQCRFLRHILLPATPTPPVGNILGLIESQYLKSLMGRWKHKPWSFHLRSYLTTFFYGWWHWGPERVAHLQKVTQLLSGIIAINRNSIGMLFWDGWSESVNIEWKAFSSFPPSLPFSLYWWKSPMMYVLWDTNMFETSSLLRELSTDS